MDNTLPPPKDIPYFKCMEEGCTNTFQPYHGKVGCACYECDDVTPIHFKIAWLKRQA